MVDVFFVSSDDTVVFFYVFASGSFPPSRCRVLDFWEICFLPPPGRSTFLFERIIARFFWVAPVAIVSYGFGVYLPSLFVSQFVGPVLAFALFSLPWSLGLFRSLLCGLLRMDLFVGDLPMWLRGVQRCCTKPSFTSAAVGCVFSPFLAICLVAVTLCSCLFFNRSYRFFWDVLCDPLASEVYSFVSLVMKFFFVQVSFGFLFASIWFRRVLSTVLVESLRCLSPDFAAVAVVFSARSFNLNSFCSA